MPVNSADLRIAVDIRRFPWMRRLALDYAYEFAALQPFFAGNPASRDAWTEAIDRAHARRRPSAELASLIQAQQQRRRAPRPAVDQAQRLASASTVAVVTGQQAGLFGGPVYTLLKAITALKLAERISLDHRVETVAVFWIDAEDHDWDEVRSCTVFDETLAPYAVALPSDVNGSTPTAAVTLGPAIDEALETLAGHLARTEFRDGLLSSLRAAYRPGVGMAEAFACWLERTLGERGLVVYDASDRACKPLAADVFLRELSTPGVTTKLASKAGAALVARGYHAQVTLPDESVAVFHLDGARRPVQIQDGDFVVGERRYARDALIALAATAPHSFSPNVLLRPIVQDTIFPTVCYVAGPNELAYLGQLRDVYAHFDVPMPLIHPRATATLVDAAALRFLTKYSIALESLQPQDEAGLNELLAGQIPAAVDAAFTGAASAIEREMAGLIHVIPGIDPTLEGAAKSTLGKMQHDLQALRGKMIQAAKRRDETLRRQYTRTQMLVFPNGRAQEREIGFVSFLNQYGPALVERLYEEVHLDLGRHWIVSI